MLVRDVGGVNPPKSPARRPASQSSGAPSKDPYVTGPRPAPRYCEVEDADGNVSDKAYDDVIPFRLHRQTVQHLQSKIFPGAN